MGMPTNLMHDKRVHRGSTTASVVLHQPDPMSMKQAPRRRNDKANRTQKRSGTPEPVVGRKHMDIQTDSYMEELTERIKAFEAETQTDFILERPQSPLFLPTKTGLDIATQVEEGELFEFDIECEPILDVIASKTLEQAMMEVLEEEELASLLAHQADYEKNRNAETLEVQRMEQAEERRHKEMKRRMQETQTKREQDLTTMRKVASRSIANAHVSSLKERALAHLKDGGVFASPVQLAVETLFMPTLLGMVSQQVGLTAKESVVLTKAVKSVMEPKLEAHERVLESERRRVKAVDDAERLARSEREAEIVRKEQALQKALAQEEALAAWEAEPPPKKAVMEVIIAEVNAEEKLATLSDGTTVPLSEEDVQNVVDMFAQLEEGQKVMGTLVDATAAELSFEGFRIGAGTGEGDAPADA